MNNHTYVVKIDTTNIDQQNISQIIDNLSNDFNIDDHNDVVIMSKKQYHNYIFDNSGLCFIYKQNDSQNHNNVCSICHNNFKNRQKLFQLKTCNHIFHHKCIKKWFCVLSDKFNAVHDCPLCRASYETLICPNVI